MKHDTFAHYLKGAGLAPETSVAGHEVWDKQLKEEYAKAAESLKELGLIK
jgi:putative tricarboxylic transport membrane protein